MMARRGVVVLLSVLLGAGTILATPAAADKRATSVTCAYDGDIYFTPGITLTPEIGKVEGVGVVTNCTGTYRDEPVGSNGSYSNAGRWSGVCGNATMKIHQQLVLEVGGRRQIIPMTIEVTSVGFAVLFTDRGPGGTELDGSGLSAFPPPSENQNCVSGVTHLTQTGFGTLHS